ncbi:MAG: hypothetical protein HC880_04730 [Bacteroidia bacterium]|nr:hypothetical protein [Bacteroidia bacterium]
MLSPFLARYQHQPENITSLYQSRKNPALMWVGTDDGFWAVDLKTRICHFYPPNPHKASALSHRAVRVVYEDAQGTVWIGTEGGGLDQFDPKTQRFNNFSEKDGLPSNHVYGIYHDANHYLWMSTGRGISRLNLKSYEFINFQEQDGLQSIDFKWGAHHQSAQGEIFFGGAQGVNSFFPGKIKFSTVTPQVRITQFSINNQRVPVAQPVDGRIILEKQFIKPSPFAWNPKTGSSLLNL